MPHQSFGTVRVGVERAPITFDFGLYGEESFTVIPEPTLGDTFDLYDAPEPTPQNMLDVTRVLARFIRKMLAVEDRPRFDEALKRIPASQCHIIYECAEWVTRQITPFESAPRRSSSTTRRTNGTSSKRKPAATRSR